MLERMDFLGDGGGPCEMHPAEMAARAHRPAGGGREGAGRDMSGRRGPS